MTAVARAGIIGCGKIASLHEEDTRLGRVFAYATHAKAYAHHPRAELAAAADPDPDRRARFGRTWNVTRLYGSAEQMFDAERLDVVSVCTATPLHAVACLAAIDAGVPVVLCEKPLSDSLVRATEVVEAAERRGTAIAVNYTRRFSHPHRELARYLAGGAIGPLQAVMGAYSKGLRNHGSHLIDLLLWYAGPIVRVRAEPLLFDDVAAPDPTLNLWLEFERGFHGVLVGTAYAHYKVLEVDLFGTRGRARIDDDRLSLFETVEYEALENVRGLRAVPPPVELGIGHAMYDAIDNVVSHRLDATPLAMTARAALETEFVLEAAVRSAAERRAVEVDEVRAGACL